MAEPNSFNLRMFPAKILGISIQVDVFRYFDGRAFVETTRCFRDLPALVFTFSVEYYTNLSRKSKFDKVDWRIEDKKG